MSKSANRSFERITDIDLRRLSAVPDFALDQHTLEGRKLKRRITHFCEEGARLIPEPTEPDLYIEEAYRLWRIKAQGK